MRRGTQTAAAPAKTAATVPARPVDQPLRNERYRIGRELSRRAEFMRVAGPIAGAAEWNRLVAAHAALLEQAAELLYAGPEDAA